MIVCCATTNRGKLREFRHIVDHFAQGRIQVDPLETIRQIPPCEETGATFEENARLKAAYYSLHTRVPLFADDSGLAVDALAGAPGVLSARYAGEGATDGENNGLLLHRLRGVEDRCARFVCAIAVAERGRILATFHGQVEGHIIGQPLGSNGFGYDPLFFFPGFQCTFGQATEEQKTLVSHRSRALRQMVDWLLAER
jgi:XTP/dITP diphosphohydrolase